MINRDTSSLNERIKAWKEVFTNNITFFRGKLFTLINASILLTIFSIFIVITGLVGLVNGNNNQFAVVLTIFIIFLIISIIGIYIVIALIFQLIALNKIFKKQNGSEIYLRRWIKMLFKKMPTKYANMNVLDEDEEKLIAKLKEKYEQEKDLNSKDYKEEENKENSKKENE
ncbi:hypothetical protein MM26B8_01290 [Mycoplasmopsis meleagridis]|uniref:Transmembrane protein n=1 Tax=Mycoplasmopsis meleagridis ATCC 25294 TaxID=1264554 RepID=A0A0F5H249_9BACT|nr:hypothetical protein [Mycoplasmopsis meleagridis]KKB26917.1 hypothetical protein MMELEA_03660 [Mycoplasmopsis meleagridis ATCC 25294]OAD18505.1 hypothetical protein MM26B8_01290 [Mycoplasmopsis meleagridis]VEU77625.1 Uncharacterised protein [Mycoplasmopsis meleagridis]